MNASLRADQPQQGRASSHRACYRCLESAERADPEIRSVIAESGHESSRWYGFGAQGSGGPPYQMPLTWLYEYGILRSKGRYGQGRMEREWSLSFCSAPGQV